MSLLISYFFLQEDLSFSYSVPDHLVCMVTSGSVRNREASYFRLDQHGLLWHKVLFWYSSWCIWERAVIYRSFLWVSLFLCYAWQAYVERYDAVYSS